MRHTPIALAALEQAYDGLSMTAKAVLATGYILCSATINGMCSCSELRGVVGLSEEEFDVVCTELNEAGCTFRVDNDELWVSLASDLLVFAVGAPGRPKAKDWEGLKVRLFSQWFEDSTPHCMYCHVEGVPLTLDHGQPVSRGGSNHPVNFLAACHPCNTSKGDKTFQEYMIWRKERGL